MSFTRFFAVAAKETRHVLRDGKTLTAAFLIPVLLIFLFCDSLSLDVEDVPLAVFDQDRTPQSADLAERLEAGGCFRVVGRPSSYRELQGMLDGGLAEVSVVIPSHFGRDLLSGRCGLQVLVDGVNPSRTTAASGYVSMILEDYFAEAAGGQAAGRSVKRVNPRPRVWYNPSLESRNAIVPGLIALIMAILSALLTSTAVSKEWEGGSMELLLSTPVSKAEIIFGKFIPYFVIGAVDCSLLVLIASAVYGVQVKGSLALLALSSSLFLSGVLFQGLAISIAARNSLVANIAALLSTFLPTMLLSGFVFYIPGMPAAIRAVSCMVPGKYFISCARGVCSRASGLEFIAADLIFLALFSLIAAGIGFAAFKKRID